MRDVDSPDLENQKTPWEREKPRNRKSLDYYSGKGSYLKRAGSGEDQEERGGGDCKKSMLSEKKGKRVRGDG